MTNELQNWIYIKSKNDLPKDTYKTTKAVYLTITESGTLYLCKFTDNPNGYLNFKSISNWQTQPTKVVAYKQIHIPKDIKDKCPGRIYGMRYADYFEQL